MGFYYNWRSRNTWNVGNSISWLGSWATYKRQRELSIHIHSSLLPGWVCNVMVLPQGPVAMTSPPRGKAPLNINQNKPFLKLLTSWYFITDTEKVNSGQPCPRKTERPGVTHGCNTVSISLTLYSYCQQCIHIINDVFILSTMYSYHQHCIPIFNTVFLSSTLYSCHQHGYLAP